MWFPKVVQLELQLHDSLVTIFFSKSIQTYPIMISFIIHEKSSNILPLAIYGRASNFEPIWNKQRKCKQIQNEKLSQRVILCGMHGCMKNTKPGIWHFWKEKKNLEKWLSCTNI